MRSASSFLVAYGTRTRYESAARRLAAQVGFGIARPDDDPACTSTKCSPPTADLPVVCSAPSSLRDPADGVILPHDEHHGWTSR